MWYKNLHTNITTKNLLLCSDVFTSLPKCRNRPNQHDISQNQLHLHRMRWGRKLKMWEACYEKLKKQNSRSTGLWLKSSMHLKLFLNYKIIIPPVTVKEVWYPPFCTNGYKKNWMLSKSERNLESKEWETMSH